MIYIILKMRNGTSEKVITPWSCPVTNGAGFNPSSVWFQGLSSFHFAVVLNPSYTLEIPREHLKHVKAQALLQTN